MSKVNRETILHAAIHLFNQSGYHATSMQDIARAVHIKKPSLYHHFDSKESILLAILEEGMVTLVAEVETIVQSNLNSQQKLYAAIGAHIAIIAKSPEGAAVFLREDRGIGESYIARHMQLREQFEILFRTIIEEGITSGEFHQIDVPITVHALLGMVNWMTRWYRPQGRLSAEQIVDIFSDLLLFGLVQTPDKPPSQAQLK